MSDNTLTEHLPPLAEKIAEEDWEDTQARGMALLETAKQRPGFSDRAAKIDAYVEQNLSHLDHNPEEDRHG